MNKRQEIEERLNNICVHGFKYKDCTRGCFPRLIESTISQTKQELIDKVESKLYTENGFFREDDGVAPDVQGVLQDIKLQKLSNK